MIWLLFGQLLIAGPSAAMQQDSLLTISQARTTARDASVSIAAARAASDVAAGRERQSAAHPNPILSYAREQTASASNQDVIGLDQPIEWPGLRSARMDAAQLRRMAAEARLSHVLAEADADIAVRFASLISAQARVQVTRSAAAQFARAGSAMRERLASGDVSGYAARRVALEATRYGALAAEAESQLNTARERIAELTRTPVTAGAVPELLPLALPLDSIAVVAANHPLVRAARFDARAAAADARLARASALPSPLLTAGIKTERATGVSERATGFVAGVAFTLPLWDRRGGAIAAADADARRLLAETENLERQIIREARALHVAVRRTDEQLVALRNQLGAEAQAALRAAEVAYDEGEITLVEWLDAVRAYQEAEAAYANVLAEAITQRAVLERLIGIRLIG